MVVTNIEIRFYSGIRLLFAFLYGALFITGTTEIKYMSHQYRVFYSCLKILSVWWCYCLVAVVYSHAPSFGGGRISGLGIHIRLGLVALLWQILS